ncbi:Mrp/NBP35 family ATP-binding protein [Phreatobacter sp.]|uniref:Mrp/NBP35 family ATP-binding protein n=1 Tax=Phreatobacter sp. TaxID=1966341 RepID=UPI0022BE2D0D|nr:Mrp/NBP35 family ATP-binding protein [Phreatobacter sp.]MCZ8315290.1 Mrp/NBP35 family ATP-binding protein [Phreatobacter sp.]
MMVTREEVARALEKVLLPASGQSLTASGRLSDIVVTGERVMVAIAIDPTEAPAMEPVRAAAQSAISGIPGVGQVFVSLTADRAPGAAATATRPAPSTQPHVAPGRPTNAPSPKVATIPGVKHVIAVASGKGGVGKSTTACNLALALAANGRKVGILDADIYGPSLPKLFGLSGKPRVVSGRTLAPLENFGVKVMSIGFMVEEETPMIWRGPMVMSAITQMLREVAWGELDVLVVDMPPGTGDAQLTMAQATPLAGAVIVSTPQDLALIDARRGVAMFRKTEVPILGIVENMSYFIAPDTGKRYDIFGHGGARAEATRLGVPFLGEIPLDMDLRARSDSGRPLVATVPDSPHALVYREIARQVWASLTGTGDVTIKPPPRIIIE